MQSSENFKLDFGRNVDVIVSFVYSDPGKYTNEIFDCGGSLFAAAICIFTLEQGKESGGKRNPVYYGCLHHSKRMGVFSRWFFGIFISFLLR